MIKHFCDTCGAEINNKPYAMTISMNGLEAIAYKEFDLCDKCRKKILTAAERHAWEAPQSDEKPEEVKEVKEGPKPEAKKKRTVDYGKIMALKNAGWTGRQIAAEVHLSEAAVWAAIKKSKEEGITGEGYLDEEE